MKHFEIEENNMVSLGVLGILSVLGALSALGALGALGVLSVLRVISVLGFSVEMFKVEYLGRIEYDF